MDKKYILWVIVVLYLLSACNLSVADATYKLNKEVIWVSFFIDREGGSITMKLITPNGSIITPDDAKNSSDIKYIEDGLKTFYEISNPEEGYWTIMENISNWSGQTQQLKYSSYFEGSLDVDFNNWIYGVNLNPRDNGDIFEAGQNIEMDVELIGTNITKAGISLVIERPDGTKDQMSFVNMSACQFTAYYNNTDIEGTYRVKGHVRGLMHGYEFYRNTYTYFIIQKYPDFKIDATDIVFSNASLKTGDVLPINVAISNIGTVSGTVTAEIYYGWEPVENISVFLANGTNTTISTQLKVKDLEYQEVQIILKQFPPCIHRCENNMGNNFVKKSLYAEDSVYLAVKHSFNRLYDYSLAIILIFVSLFAIHKYKERIKLKIKTRIRRIIGRLKKINKKDILAIIFIILVVSFILLFLWQLGLFSGGPGGTGSRPNACGGYSGWGRIHLMEPSIRLLYDGTFSASMMNGLGGPMNLIHIGVIYEGERHNEGMGGKKCIIQQPVGSYSFGSGEIIRLIAYCPPINKNAEYASLYLTFEYEYVVADNKISRTESGNRCLSNDGDEFS